MVDNMQALATKVSSGIPDRYIRPERKEEIVAGNDEDTKPFRSSILAGYWIPSTLMRKQQSSTRPVKTGASSRETIDEYAKEAKKVADDLLKIMSKNLGLKFEDLYEMFNEGIQSLRFNYYPSCPSPEKVIGFSPHTDPTGLTLLLQINESHGLQIKRYGRWLSIDATPNAFIVNIGDITEILSNGKYKSIEHRAVVNSKKEWLSVAGFHTLRLRLAKFFGFLKSCFKSIS